VLNAIYLKLKLINNKSKRSKMAEGVKVTFEGQSKFEATSIDVTFEGQSEFVSGTQLFSDVDVSFSGESSFVAGNKAESIEE
jgi:hypothetical protein